MNRLARIAKSATPATGIHFRAEPYGRAGVRSFLRDVLALANAATDGPRYIIIGMDFDAGGRKRVHPVDSDDFSGKLSYHSLVTEYIEPLVRVTYKAVTVDGQRVGIFEIDECEDKPYMMRIDHSDSLRRGDAYIRVNDAAIKMGRRQLQVLFEKSFRDAVSPSRIEIGFPGEIIHKELHIETRTLDQLPSAVASAKLTELIESRSRVRAAAGNTTERRLTFARLFGPDNPYEDRSDDEIRQELRQIERSYRDNDEYFLFEELRTDLQLVIYNQGDEALRDATIRLVLPAHSALHVAKRLPKVLRRDQRFVERLPAEQSGYPAVTLREDTVHVTTKPGDIEPGVPVEAFASPLRICVGDNLAGRRIGVRYSLLARNLHSPAEGKLKLLF